VIVALSVGRDHDGVDPGRVTARLVGPPIDLISSLTGRSRRRPADRDPDRLRGRLHRFGHLREQPEFVGSLRLVIGRP